MYMEKMGRQGTYMDRTYNDYTKVLEMYDISKIQLVVYHQCCILIG